MIDESRIWNDIYLKTIADGWISSLQVFISRNNFVARL